MIIDTHCHLTDEKFENREKVIVEAKNQGVEKIIVPAVSISSSREVVKIANSNEGVFGVVGIHPEEIIEGRWNKQEYLVELEELFKNKKIVGVGEIGLDFYWDKEKKSMKEQLEVFNHQLDLALKLNKPAVVHMRGAESEMWNLFKNRELPDIQMHCWSGSDEFLDWCVNKKMSISFAGNITFKNADNLRNHVKLIPIDQLLLETDSPYLSPEPRRGETNEPRNVKIIGEFIAQIRQIEPEKLFEQTSKNAICFFSLENL